MGLESYTALTVEEAGKKNMRVETKNPTRERGNWRTSADSSCKAAVSGLRDVAASRVELELDRGVVR